MGSLAFCLFQSICLLEELFWFSRQLPKKISNNSLPTILWVLSLFFCYQLSGLKPTYILLLLFSASLTAAENNQIKKTKSTTSHLKKKEPNIAYIHIQNCLFWVFGLTQNLLL